MVLGAAAAAATANGPVVDAATLRRFEIRFTERLSFVGGAAAAAAEGALADACNDWVARLLFTLALSSMPRIRVPPHHKQEPHRAQIYNR